MSTIDVPAVGGSFTNNNQPTTVGSLGVALSDRLAGKVFINVGGTHATITADDADKLADFLRGAATEARKRVKNNYVFTVKAPSYFEAKSKMLDGDWDGWRAE